MKTAAIGALVASAFMALLWTGMASAAGQNNGSLEICKSGLNGAAGQTFKIAYQKGSAGAPTSVPVTGGSCNAAISVPPGTYILTEDLSSGLWMMTGDNVTPSSAWVSDSVKKGTLKVSVVANQETQAELVNAPAGATVKVCKWSASPALQGAQYSFNVNGQTVTATAGKNAANAGCSTALATQPGTKLKIQESVPSGETVASVTFNGASVSNAAGLVKVTAGTGANVVVYEDEPVGPPQTGYVEVCKDAGDDYVADTTTPFQFTITDKTGFQDVENVLVGQCTGPIKVAAGNVSIAETQTGSTFVSSITAFPDPNALGPTNLTNGTTTAVVPVSSDPSGEVQVHFVNTTVTATLKVCKYLTAGSDALAGKTFTFVGSFGETTGDGYGTHNFELTVTATAGANGACKVVTNDDAEVPWVPDGSGSAPLQIPVGATVNVEEQLGNYPYVSGDGNQPGVNDTQGTTVVNGINTVSFHNQALGQLEICKAMQKIPGADDTNFNNIAVFHFTIDGATWGPLADVAVAAGHCSMPLIVPVGQHTIKENTAVTLGIDTATIGFAFVSATATGPTGDNRVVSGGNPVTVSVPYFSDPVNGGETLVTITNRVLRVQIKVCKVVEPGSLTPIGGDVWSYSATNGTFASAKPDQTASNGTCTGLIVPADPTQSAGWQLITTSGSDVEVTVTESLVSGNPAWFISDATVSPASSIIHSTNTVTWFLSPGVNVVTITNKYGGT